jgi:anti-sigma factor RsiW
MNGCSTVQAGFTEYLDGRLNGREMQDIGAHLKDCDECAREWESLRHAQSSLAALGPAPEPADLPLRIRVAVSRERARMRRGYFAGWVMTWKNTVGPFVFQASAGLASAVLLLGTVIVLSSMFAQPEQAQATRSQVENMLLFSVFEPARFFGQPVRGLAVLSFSGVSVRG